MLVNVKSKYRPIIITIIAIFAIYSAAIVFRSVQNKYSILINEDAQNHSHVNLSSIPWPDYQRPNISTVTEVGKMGPLDMKTSVGQQKTLEILVKSFKEAMREADLDGQWFLHAGALLGSLQHHDFIPWDEDADFMLNIKYRPLVQASLKKLGPKLRTHAIIAMDKLFFAPFDPDEKLTPESIGSHYETGYPWAWPFIDVAYYEEYQPDKYREFNKSIHKFNIHEIFPLQYRPLGKEWFPVPKRPLIYLKNYYGTKQQICKSHSWSHSSEKSIKSVTEDCRKLMNKYAFVHRCPIPKWEFLNPPSGLCDEYLVNGKGEVIHKLRLELSEDECKSPLYTVRHKSFNCP